MKHIFVLFVCCSLFAAFCGCGSDFVRVNGKVSFDDGSPVTKGNIAFSTISFMADGEIKPDGTYTLSSLKPGDGLPPGRYQVTVNSSETDNKEKTVYLVDKMFGETATTPLTAEVAAGKRTFDFEVSKPKKK